MRRFPIMSTVGFLLWNSIPGPNWEHVCAFMLALTAVIVNYFLISYFHYFLPVKGSEVHALMQSFNIGFLFLVHVTVECLLILVIICLSNMLAPVSPITKIYFRISYVLSKRHWVMTKPFNTHIMWVIWSYFFKYLYDQIFQLGSCGWSSMEFLIGQASPSTGFKMGEDSSGETYSINEGKAGP